MINKSDLDFRLWSTSITRFNAAKRVDSWRHCIRWSLFFTSIYLTILSILLYSGKIQKCFCEHCQFTSIFLSILILCLSLAVNLNQLEIKSFKHHESGRKIRRLLNNLSMIDDQVQINDLSKEYDDILDENENHSSIDYYQFVWQHSKKFTQDQKLKMPPWYILYVWFPLARYALQMVCYFLTVFMPLFVISKIVDF